VSVPSPKPGWRSRILALLARRFGPSFVLPTINVLERADSGSYHAQPEAVAGGLPTAERSHARVLDALAGKSGLSGSSIAQLEGRHRAMGGNSLRAAVLGANDGLVSNLSLITGMTGVTGSEHIVLLSGFAGLVAGAWSFCLFAAGAAVPLLPFLFFSGLNATFASLAASGAALALVGAGTSLFTGRGAPFSAGRQIAIGALAATVTYGMGRLAGVVLAR
jgi:hypothetical protein